MTGVQTCALPISYFFALAYLGWFVHPWALAIATTWVVGVIYWREFHSAEVRVLQPGPVDSTLIR